MTNLHMHETALIGLEWVQRRIWAAWMGAESVMGTHGEMLELKRWLAEQQGPQANHATTMCQHRWANASHSQYESYIISSNIAVRRGQTCLA